jgi:hypothetical protein
VYIWGDPYYWHLHGSFGTNIADPCSYVGYYGAECRQAPGLWPNGDPIFSWLSVGGIGGGDITGWNPNSPPINLPPPSLWGFPTDDPRCDWGSCTDPGSLGQFGNAFSADPDGNSRWRQIKDVAKFYICGDTPEQGKERRLEQLGEHMFTSALVGGFFGSVVGTAAGLGLGGPTGAVIGMAGGLAEGAAIGASIGAVAYIGCRYSGH